MLTDGRINELIYTKGYATREELCRAVEAEVRAEAQDPVLWQRRMRPSWADWNQWQDCAREAYDDCKKVPVVGDWSYEARALYTTPQTTSPCPKCAEWEGSWHAMSTLWKTVCGERDVLQAKVAELKEYIKIGKG